MCGLDLTGCDSSEEVDLETGRSLGVAAEAKEVDEMCFAYLTSVGGEKILEGRGQRIVLSISQARLALNRLRAAPTSISGPNSRIRSPITGRKVAWLPRWKWRRDGIGGLWLWDMLPGVVTAQPEFTIDQLNTMVKLCEKNAGEFKRPDSPCKVPKTTEAEECAKFIDLCIACFEIALEQMVLATVSGYAIDKAPTLELVKDEFQSQTHQQPPLVVFATLNAYLEDMSLRVERSASTPSVDHLTFYERSCGGAVRFMFNPSCAGVLQHVTAVKEQRIANLGWTGFEQEFNAGQKQDTPVLTDAEKLAKKELKDKRKKEKKEKKTSASATLVATPVPTAGAPAAPKAEPKAVETPKETPKLSPTKGAKGGKGKGRGGSKGGNGKGGRGKGAWSGRREVDATDQEDVPEGNPEDDLGEDWDGFEEEETKEDGSGKASPTVPSHLKTSRLGTTTEGTPVPIRAGELHGDGIVFLLEKMRASYPRIEVSEENCSPCVRELCPFWVSSLKCSHPACSRYHPTSMSETPPEVFSPAWHVWLLLQGGHQTVAETLSEESICDLLTVEQVENVMGLNSASARRDLLLRHLFNRLSNLMHANSEPIDTMPITSGLKSVHREVMWQESPFKLASPSGLGPCTYSRLAVGCKDFVWQAQGADTGDQIGEFPSLCAIKAVATVAPRPTKSVINNRSLSPDMILLRDSVKGVLQHDWARLKFNSIASFRLISVARALKNFRGFLIDTLWSVLGPNCASQYHILQICSGLGEGITYRLNVVHSEVATAGEIQFKPALAKQQQNRSWKASALAAPVVVVLVDRPGVGEGRHSEGLILGKGMHSLRSVHKKLMQGAMLGEKVIYSKRNAVKELNEQLRSSSITQKDLNEARETFKWAGQRLGLEHWELQGLTAPPGQASSGKARKATPEPTYPLHDLTEVEELIREARRSSTGMCSDLDTGSESHSELISDTKSLKPEETGSSTLLELESLPDLRAEWSRWHETFATKPKLSGPSKWAKFYLKHYLPLFGTEEFSEESPLKALTFCSQFFNKWLKWQIDHQRLEPRKALERIVTAIRKESFGARASAGPDWEQVHQVIKGALSTGHINLLQENSTWGADPLFVDSLFGKGEWNESGFQDVKLTLKLLKDQLTEVEALRGLVFNFEEPGVMEALLKAGVRVSPIVTAVKRKPHGDPVLDADGDPMLRVCVHCSFGENAPNLGMHPAEHTRQKNTFPELLVLNALQEETRYPSHELRFIRDDLASAFRQIAVRLHRIGLFATTVLCFVMVNLTLIFGAGPAPGDFDPLGDAILKTVLAEERPTESWKLVGERHPECGRFVDDLFSIIAMTGNRCGDHIRRLRRIVVAIMGPGGINVEKQEEEGTPTCFKHVFGVVLDAVDRLVMAPWSKIVKLFHLSIDFVNGVTEGLSLESLE